MSLPTNITFHKAQCVNKNLCPFCQIELETHLHALQDYNQIKPIWFSLHPPQDSFQKNYEEWIESTSKNSTHITYLESPDQSYLFILWEPFGLYETKKSSKITLLKTIQSETPLSLKLQNLIWSSLSTPTNLNNTIANSQTTISAWIKPTQRWSKLNIDGSTKNNYITWWGVIRTDQGESVIGFTKFIGISTTTMVEAWELFTGIQIATFIKIRKFKLKWTTGNSSSSWTMLKMIFTLLLC